MMKKTQYIFIGIVLVLFGVSYSNVSAQLRVITAPQGGTGIGSAVVGDVGNCLKVSDDSPFTYQLASCGNSFPTSTNPLMASYFVATSTNATSSFLGGVRVNNIGDRELIFGANSTALGSELTSSNKMFYDGNGTLTVRSQTGFDPIINVIGSADATFGTLTVSDDRAPGNQLWLGTGFSGTNITTGFYDGYIQSFDQGNQTTYLILQPAGGYLGIGNQDPQYNVDVAGNVNVTGNYYINGTPFTASQWITDGSAGIYYDAGTVGIGTGAAPTARFEINDTSGGANVTAKLTTGGTYGTTANTMEWYDFNGVLGGRIDEFGYLEVNQGNPTVSTKGTGIASFRMDTTVDTGGRDWRFENGRAGTGIFSISDCSAGCARALTASSTRNIGLGVDDAKYRLDVVGAGHFTTLVDAQRFVATSTTATSTFGGGLTVGAGATPKFLVDRSTGKVGIATTSPTYNLEVNGSFYNTGTAIISDAYRFYSGGTDGIANWTDFRTNPSTGNGIISAKNNAMYINFDHGGSGGVILNLSGSVGQDVVSFMTNGQVGTINSGKYGWGSLGASSYAAGAVDPLDTWLYRSALGIVATNATSSFPVFTATSTSATSTVSNALYVASTTPTQNFAFAVGSSSPNLIVDRNTGKVGIGTSSPSNTLGITGGWFTTATSTGMNGINLTAGCFAVNGTCTGSGSGTGITWSEVTGTTGSMSVNNGYVTNNAATTTLTIPTTCSIGQIVRVTGVGKAWKIAQNASEIIHFGNIDSTTGTGGYLESTHKRDAVELVCVVADTEWNVLSSQGNITIN